MLSDWASFGHDITISKISSKVCKAVENLLKKTVAVSMKQRHQANVIRPMYPVWIVDYGNKVEKNLTEDRPRPVVGTDGSDENLMQRLEKSTMDCIVPMRAIAVFPLVL
jgi:hypothetical protein